MECVKLLLSHPKVASKIRERYEIPLYNAIDKGHDDCAETVLKSMKVLKGDTLLHIATRTRSEKIVHWLIERKGEVVKKKEKCQSPLDIAKSNGDSHLTKLMEITRGGLHNEVFNGELKKLLDLWYLNPTEVNQGNVIKSIESDGALTNDIYGWANKWNEIKKPKCW